MVRALLGTTLLNCGNLFVDINPSWEFGRYDFTRRKKTGGKTLDSGIGGSHTNEDSQAPLRRSPQKSGNLSSLRLRVENQNWAP